MSEIKSISHRCLVLFSLYVLYIVLGGLAFRCLEREAREDMVEDTTDELEQERQQFLNVLWAETMVNKEDDWLEVANDRLDLYEQKLKDAFGQGIDLQDDEPANDSDDDNQWTLEGSIFYCFTVVTTIGYGNLAPATTLGQCLTIIYGAFGIPLTLILMGELGKLITLLLKTVLAKRYPDIDTSDEFTFGVIASICITVPFLMVGALILWYLEDDWSFFDACYFSFITYSTIGFGDMVPKNLGTTLLCMGYILMALSLCALCFTVFQVALDDWLNAKQEAISDWWKRRQISIDAAKAKKTDGGTPLFSYSSNLDEDQEEEVDDVEIEDE